MFVFVVCCVVLCVGLSKGSNGFPRGALRMNVGGSTAISDVQAHENSGCAFQKSIFVGVQVSGVYLSKGTTVGNKKPEAS